MVTTFSMSFWTAALTNNKVNPAQTNNTKSTPGRRSVSPAITANRLGIVDACNTITANQPNVSDEIAVNLVVTKILKL